MSFLPAQHREREDDDNVACHNRSPALVRERDDYLGPRLCIVRASAASRERLATVSAQTWLSESSDLGYVGLPLAVGFAEAGEHVVAVDVDDAKVAAIRAGQSYVEDISSERLAAVADQIDAQTHFAPLARTDAILICVPTPLDPQPRAGPRAAAVGDAKRSQRSCSRAS